MFRFTIAVCLTALVFLTGLCLADIPKLINYQGMLTDKVTGDPITNPGLAITFRVYNHATSTDPASKMWEETHSSVEVTDGLFNVILGSQSKAGLDLDFSEAYWLEVVVGGEVMGERLQFTSVGYAYRALVADSATVAVSAPTGGGWTDDGTVVRLASGTDSVGIGTGDPAERLHVNGDIRLNLGSTVAFGDDATRVYGSSGDLRITAADDIYLQPDDDIYIRADGGSDWIRFDPGDQKVGIGTTAPLTTAHVRGSSLSLPTEAIHYDEFILEDEDAILGLYSGSTGPAGSAITFGEVAGGALAEKWAIIRETAGGGKGLRVTYGTGKDQFVNPTVMYLDSLGNVGIGTKIPHSTLRVNGSQAMAIKYVNGTSLYALTDSDCILVVNPTLDNITVDLPSAVGIAGRVYTIKNIGTLLAMIRTSENIDGQPQLWLSEWEYATVVSDGSNWLIIGKSP